MTELAEAEFKVVRNADDQLWLEITRGKGSRLRVAVPKWNPEYSEQLVEQIHTLGKGDVIDATLVSTNERNTAWRFEDIQDLRPEASGLAPADD